MKKIALILTTVFALTVGACFAQSSRVINLPEWIPAKEGLATKKFTIGTPSFNENGLWIPSKEGKRLFYCFSTVPATFRVPRGQDSLDIPNPICHRWMPASVTQKFIDGYEWIISDVPEALAKDFIK